MLLGECTTVLKGQIIADDSIVEEITSKVMKCPSKIGLKVATDPVSQVSRTPAWYRHTEGTEAVTAETEQFRWRREFCEAVD